MKRIIVAITAFALLGFSTFANGAGYHGSSNQVVGAAWSNDGTKTTILPPTGDYLRIGDAGTTSHTLNANDDLFVSGELEVDGVIYLDATLNIPDAVAMVLGTGSDVSLLYSSAQTPDALVLGLGTDSRGLVICENADIATDFTHAQQTNPTLFVQSADATTVADYISIAHDQTNGQIASGTGFLNLNAPGGVVLQDEGVDALVVTSDGTKSTILPATGDYLRVGDATAGTSHGLNSNDDILITRLAEFDNTAFFDAGAYLYAPSIVADNVGFNFGAVSDTQLVHSTVQTPDGFVIGVGAENNSLILTQAADVSTDFAHPLQTNPTLFVQSADQTTVADWISLSHDQADAVIGVGAGGLKVNGSEGKGQSTNIRTKTESVTFAGNPGDASKATTGSVIPDGAFVVGVSTRVTTAATNCASVNIGDGVDADMFGAATGVSAGTVTTNADATAQFGKSPATAAGEITVTGVGGNCFDGVWAITVHYLDVTGATAN